MKVLVGMWRALGQSCIEAGMSHGHPLRCSPSNSELRSSTTWLFTCFCLWMIFYYRVLLPSPVCLGCRLQPTPKHACPRGPLLRGLGWHGHGYGLTAREYANVLTMSYLSRKPSTHDPHPPPSVLMRLLRRNSMAALDLHVPAAAAPGGPAPELPLAGSTSSDIIAARSGAVLGGCRGGRGGV